MLPSIIIPKKNKTITKRKSNKNNHMKMNTINLTANITIKCGKCISLRNQVKLFQLLSFYYYFAVCLVFAENVVARIEDAVEEDKDKNNNRTL